MVVIFLVTLLVATKDACNFNPEGINGTSAKPALYWLVGVVLMTVAYMWAQNKEKGGTEK